jgi:uncharacterized membrane protein YdjX (TVP38/TMEM64 family)
MTTDKIEHSVKKNIFGIGIFLLVLIGIMSVFMLVGKDNIKGWIDSVGIFGPILFIFIHASTIVFAPLEGSFLMLSAGKIFSDFWMGVFYVSIAGILGSSINFWVARIFGQRIIQKLVGIKGYNLINKTSEKINQNPILLVPLMASTLFDIMGYAAGLSGIKYNKFLIAIIISSCVNVPIYVALGDNLLDNKEAIWWIVGMVLAIMIFYLFYRTFYYILTKVFLPIEESAEIN